MLKLRNACRSVSADMFQMHIGALCQQASLLQCHVGCCLNDPSSSVVGHEPRGLRTANNLPRNKHISRRPSQMPGTRAHCVQSCLLDVKFEYYSSPPLYPLFCLATPPRRRCAKPATASLVVHSNLGVCFPAFRHCQSQAFLAAVAWVWHSLSDDCTTNCRLPSPS